MNERFGWRKSDQKCGPWPHLIKSAKQICTIIFYCIKPPLISILYIRFNFISPLIPAINFAGFLFSLFWV